MWSSFRYVIASVANRYLVCQVTLLELQEIHLEMAASMPAVGAGGAEAAVARARAYERGNDYARAIEAYLSLSPADTNNLDALQQCWEQVNGNHDHRENALMCLPEPSMCQLLNLVSSITCNTAGLMSVRQLVFCVAGCQCGHAASTASHA